MSAADALGGTTRLAQRADELGYTRFWVAEHHSIPAVVGGPQTVHAELLDLVERTGTDELMLVSQVVDADQRIAGIERIARAWELSPQASAPVAG